MNETPGKNQSTQIPKTSAQEEFGGLNAGQRLIEEIAWLMWRRLQREQQAEAREPSTQSSALVPPLTDQPD
jgi:hypothetical protein